MDQKFLILYNAITNYGRALIQGLVSFLLVPFIVGYIGSESYGVVLLAIAAYGMIEQFGMGLGKAVIKFFAQERAKDQTSLINMIFNSSILWFFLIGLIGSVVTYVLGFYFDSIFSNVSPLLVEEGRLAMYIISATMIPCIVLDVFVGILSGEQRYDIVNLIGTTSAVLRALVIIAYFLFIKPSLLAVVIVYSVFYIVERIGYVIASYKIIDTLKLSFSLINKQVLKLIIGFASMMLIITTANMLAGHIFKFLLGAKLTMTDLTYYGVLLLLSTTANFMVRSFVNILVPVVSKYQGLNNYQIINKIFIYGTKFAIIVIFSLALITMPFLKGLLTLWMGPEFSKLWPIGIIMFIGQIFNSSAVAANQVLSGLGRVKVLALSSLISVLIGFGLSLFYLEFWINATLLITVTLLTTRELVNAAIVLLYGFRNLHINKSFILKNAYLVPFVISLIVLVFGIGLTILIDIESWSFLIFSVLIIEILYFVMIYFYSLDNEEKSFFKEILNKVFNKFILVKTT